MTTPILVGTVAALLGLWWLFRKWQQKAHAAEPPEPWTLPLVGYSINLKPRAYLGFMRLKKRYPDIVKVHFGQQPVIVLNSYTAVKEALVVKNNYFLGRMTNSLNVQLGLGPGIINADGPLWKEHRRFALRTLHDFGLGTRSSEHIVQEEVSQLCVKIDSLLQKGEDQINVVDLLLRSVSNVICTMALSEQPGYEDDEFTEVLNRLRHHLSRSVFTAPTFMFREAFALMRPLWSVFEGTRSGLSNLKYLVDYLQTKIDAHKRDFRAEDEPRDYIDAYLREMAKLDQTAHTFSDAQLSRELLDLFVAGTDTTSNSLSWGLLLLAMNPDIQAKCFEEIESHIGRERPPTMKDKEDTPYVLAVLDEVQRFASIVPQGLIHRCEESTTVLGYNIPKDTIVVPFVYGVHHDPQRWERPEQFYPEHFLKPTADGKPVYQSREDLIPFLIGKRECLGESLAKMELYIFFVRLLQRYRVSLPPNMTPEVLKEVLLGSDGLIHSPGDHRLVFHQRAAGCCLRYHSGRNK